MANKSKFGFVLVVIILLFLVYMKPFSMEEGTTQLDKTATQDSTGFDKMSWFKYSAVNGDGDCMTSVDKNEVCKGDSVVFVSRGERNRLFHAAIGEDIKTWSYLEAKEASSAGKTTFNINAPGEPGTYLLRAVSIDDRGYEGCVSNIQELVVGDC